MQIKHNEFVIVPIVNLIKEVVQQKFYRLHRLHFKSTVYGRVKIEIKVDHHLLGEEVHIFKGLLAGLIASCQLEHNRFLDVLIFVNLVLLFEEDVKAILDETRITEADVT